MSLPEGEKKIMERASLSSVLLTDEYCTNAMQKEYEYLIGLDEKRLLHGFYLNAGLPSASSYYGGWEGTLIGGHTAGHYLSALSQMYVGAGFPQKKEIALRLDNFLEGLTACSCRRGGFLWGASVFTEENPELQFDNLERGEGEYWVPFYTLHKILSGLLDVYENVCDERARTLADALGDWVARRVSRWDEQTRTRVLGTEYGSMNEAMYRLYSFTGKSSHLNAARTFDEEALFEKILSGRKHYLCGLHANTTIPKIQGALFGDIVTGDCRRLPVAEAFFDRVLKAQTFITGGNSDNEHFIRDGSLNVHRTNRNCETCNVHNMLKLARSLFLITGKKKYLDYFENAFINSILSSQNPETGMTTYFQPMATGYFKVYSTSENSFWCCTGTGMENFTRLNDGIFYIDRTRKTVVVAMYFSSSLETEFLCLDVDARLESSDCVTVRVGRGVGTLRLRIPDWTGRFTVRVNGTERGKEEDGFYCVNVSAGDTVTVTMLRRLSAHCLKGGACAFRYGPFVLSAGLKSGNMRCTTTGAEVTIPVRKYGDRAIALPCSLREFILHLPRYLVKGDDGAFYTAGCKPALVFSYYFRRHAGRYGIYFHLAEGQGDAGVREEDGEGVS